MKFFKIYKNVLMKMIGEIERFRVERNKIRIILYFLLIIPIIPYLLFQGTSNQVENAVYFIMIYISFSIILIYIIGTAYNNVLIRSYSNYALGVTSNFFLFFILVNLLDLVVDFDLQLIYSGFVENQFWLLIISLFLSFAYVAILNVLKNYKIQMNKNNIPRRLNYFVAFQLLWVFDFSQYFIIVMLKLYDLNAINNIWVILNIFLHSLIIIHYLPKSLSMKIPIQLLNLDYFDVYASKIYTNSSMKKVNKPRILKLNFSTFFPATSDSRKIYICNQQYIKTKAYIDRQREYVYVCADMNKFESKTTLFKIILEYHDGMRRKILAMDVYINLKMVLNEPIVNSVSIHNFRCKHFICLKGTNIQVKFDVRSIFEHSYSYHNVNEFTDSKIFNLESYFETRKWLFHGGPFGIGKSTMDLLTVSNNGFVPVFISPWEDHYDNDILYLIFDKLCNQTKTRFFLPKVALNKIGVNSSIVTQ